MFQKLVSNLPFNPGLMDQVSFYGQRLKQEQSIRRTGFIFLALALLIQTFAILSPAQPSLATSPNDLIYGGNGKTKAGIIAACESNNSGHGNGKYNDIREIYYYFGAITNDGTCNTLKNAEVVTINSAAANDYWSVGRQSFTPDDHQVTILGAQTTIYQGPLAIRQAGDAARNWQALKIPGKDVWILLDCGNIVTKAPFAPPSNPQLNISKTSSPAAGTFVKPGDTINYTLIYSNTGAGNATNFKVTDNVPNNTTFVSFGASGANKAQSGSQLTFWHNNGTVAQSTLGPNPFLNYQVSFVAKVNAGTPKGTVICNAATISSTQQSGTSNQVCHTVDYCAINPALGPNDVGCQPPVTKCTSGPLAGQPAPGNNIANCVVVTPIATCTYLKVVGASNTNKQVFAAKATAINGATITRYSFDADGDGKADLTNLSANGNNEVQFSYDYTNTNGSYNAILTAETSVGNVTGSACQVAVKIELPKDKNPRIVTTKGVIDATKGNIDINGKQANAGDVLIFTVTSQNFGEGRQKAYTFPEDNLGDTLEYADLLTSDADLASQGATFNHATHVITWANQDIEAAGDANHHDIITKTFAVKVKPVLPNTAQSSSNPNSFDCKMFNRFGTGSVEVTLPRTGTCTATVVQSNLPNTGPGQSLFIGFALTTIVGYFFARSRLLRKELGIVHAEYAQGGL